MLLGLFDMLFGLPLGEELEPEAAPPGRLGLAVPPEADDDGLLYALEPPEPAFWPRLQPASARARDAATMASSFINTSLNVVTPPEQASRP